MREGNDVGGNSLNNKIGRLSPNLSILLCGSSLHASAWGYRGWRASFMHKESNARPARTTAVYLNRFSRKLLVITKMLLKDIAPAASMGLRNPAAAAGMRMTL